MLFLAALAMLVSCGNNKDAGLGLTVVVYGPPKDKYPDLDPFEGCAFLKICYRLKGETKLRGCEFFDYADGTAQIERLPLGKELTVVVECYDSNTAAAQPTPQNLRSRGESVPIRHDSGEPVEQVGIYMLKVGSFGPTYSPPGEDGTPGQVTTTYSARHGAASVVLFDGRVLLAGGVTAFKKQDDKCPTEDWSNPACIGTALATAELFDPADGSFSLVEGMAGPVLMSEKRAFAAAVELPSGEVAVFGGITKDGQPTSSVDIYDPIGPAFAPGPPMAKTRSHFAATLINSDQGGYVLLVGGYGTGESSWEVWNPTMGTLATDVLIQSRWHHTATLITKKEDAKARDMVVIAGGEGGNSPGSATVRDTVEVFDIDNQTLDLEPLPLCSNGEEGSPTPAKKTLHAAAFVPKRHFLYIAGGFADSKHQDPLKDICVWNVAQEKWSGEKGAFVFKKARGALTATALPGNVVLFAGGLTKVGGTLEAAQTIEIVFEYFDEKLGQPVVDIGPGEGFPIPMLHPRWHHTAVLLSNGKVLFFGGLEGNPSTLSIVEECELFNPQ